MGLAAVVLLLWVLVLLLERLPFTEKSAGNHGREASRPTRSLHHEEMS